MNRISLSLKQLAIFFSLAAIIPSVGEAQQCSIATHGFDYEFVGESPPVQGSAAVLFLRLADQHFRFTASDRLGETDTDDIAATRFLCFSGGRATPCDSGGIDRVIFDYIVASQRVYGDVLLGTYNRAVVDLTRGSSRIRYLLTPCDCNAATQQISTLTNRQASGPLLQKSQRSIVPSQSIQLSPSTTAADGEPVFVYQIAPPDVSIARAVNLASSIFGFSGTVTDTVDTIQVDEGFDARSLTLYKASGAIEFVHEGKFRSPSYTPTLPSATDAQTIASAFLAAIGMTPPNAEIRTRQEGQPTDTGSEIPNAIAVIFEPRLQVTSSTLAHVHDGEVTVWLGHLGEVIKFEKHFRDVIEPPLTVTGRSEADALGELANRVPTTSGLTLVRSYLAFDPEQEQPFLDPVFDLMDADDELAARVVGTRFTPQLGYLGPNPADILSGTTDITLQARALSGTPPYQFQWESDRDGPLGTGESLPVRLSAGKHRVDVSVRDVNGAGVSASVLLNVGPGAGAAPAAAVRLAGAAPAKQDVLADGARITGPNGFSFIVHTLETSPMYLNSIRSGGYRRASNLYFDQFWYEIDVGIGNNLYTLKSEKCIPRKSAGVNNCVKPQTPFAQSAGATPILHTGAQGLVETSTKVNNLPGTFALNYKYALRREYCGPEPGADEKIAVWAFQGGTPLAYPLGGKCPGIRPTIEWTYTPPCGNGITGKDIQDFCSQGAALCNIPAATLQGLDKKKIYFVKDFRAKLLTAIQTNAFGALEKSALVKDAAPRVYTVNVPIPGLGISVPVSKSLPVDLVATDGTINRTFQPFWAFGDSFTYINPVMLEKSVTAARVNARGDWDNVHFKQESTRGVYFPGCNNPRFVGFDRVSCLHLHENWLNQTPAPNTPYSLGQTVLWYLLRYRAGEESPNHPSTINNGEPLAAPFPPPNNAQFRGTDLVFWVESIASSKACDVPAGGIDNTRRPCVVFPQAMFFTPK